MFVYCKTKLKLENFLVTQYFSLKTSTRQIGCIRLYKFRSGKRFIIPYVEKDLLTNRSGFYKLRQPVKIIIFSIAKALRNSNGLRFCCKIHELHKQSKDCGGLNEHL